MDTVKFIQQLRLGHLRKDGLMVIMDCNGKKTDEARKDSITFFKYYNFNIAVIFSVKDNGFLDVNSKFSTGFFDPYRKNANT